MRRALLLAGFAGVIAPGVVFAQTPATVSGILGLLNIVTGILLVASIIVIVGGFILYLVYLGSDYRERGLKIMAWGATILFVDVILVAVADVIQSALFALVGLVIVFVALAALMVAASKPASESAH